MKKEIRKIIEEKIKTEGLSMRKETGYGLFSTHYSTRRVYSMEELFNANKEGYLLVQDAGIFLLNCFTV